jgi:release factor glutamine methyltransferase
MEVGVDSSDSGSSSEFSHLFSGRSLSQAQRLYTEKLQSFGIEEGEAQAESRIVFRHVLAMAGHELMMRSQEVLKDEDALRLCEILAERRQRRPLQYILKEAYFMGLRLEVEPGVLIPRADTETLVEQAMALIAESLRPGATSASSSELDSHFDSASAPASASHSPSACHSPSASYSASVSRGTAGQDQEPTATTNCNSSGAIRRILEIGPGSGAISLALLHNFPQIEEVVAIDLSPQACKITGKNAEALGLASRLRIYEGDFLEVLERENFAPFQLVVSNPPYIPPQQMQGLEPEVAQWEPHLALLGTDDDGLGFYRLFASRLPELESTARATLLVEHGDDQARELEGIFIKEGWQDIKSYRDLGQCLRVLALRPRRNSI